MLLVREETAGLLCPAICRLLAAKFPFNKVQMGALAYKTFGFVAICLALLNKSHVSNATVDSGSVSLD